MTGFAQHASIFSMFQHSIAVTRFTDSMVNASAAWTNTTIMTQPGYAGQSI
jgi:hypothetical protein